MSLTERLGISAEQAGDISRRAVATCIFIFLLVLLRGYRYGVLRP